METNNPTEIVPLCLYHAADLDGKCSAAIVYHALKGKVELYPINYNYPVPWEKTYKRQVILVDFTLQPFEDMFKLAKSCRPETIIWIDHHETALNDWADLAKNGKDLNCIANCRVGTAGCELTWEHFFPEKNMPPGVQLLGRYDVWDHSNPDTLSYQSGMRFMNFPPEHRNWLLIFEYHNSYVCREYHHEILETGKVILQFSKQQDEAYAKSRSYETTFEGLRAIVCNKGLANSKLFDGIYDPEKYDVMIIYCRTPNKDWAVKLFSTKPEIHCGELCKKHGGGGHKGAGGFSCRDLPFDF